MNDFQRIALGKRDVGERRARYDLAIALDRDLLDVEAQRRDQIGNAACAHLPRIAVENDGNHESRLLCLLTCSPYRGSDPRRNRKTVPLSNECSETPAVFVLSGPNLNLLGTREPEIYGHDTLEDIHERLAERAAALGLRVDCRQSNHEGTLIDWLHEAHFASAKAVLLNAGGYTHTSVALHDAIKSIRVPVIEVHLSDPMKRESFRHISYIGMAATAHFAGHGADSYMLALDAAARF